MRCYCKRVRYGKGENAAEFTELNSGRCPIYLGHRVYAMTLDFRPFYQAQRSPALKSKRRSQISANHRPRAIKRWQSLPFAPVSEPAKRRREPEQPYDRGRRGNGRRGCRPVFRAAVAEFSITNTLTSDAEFRPVVEVQNPAQGTYRKPNRRQLQGTRRVPQGRIE